MVRRAFVQLHDQIRAQFALDIDRAFGRQKPFATVEVGAEFRPLLRDLQNRFFADAVGLTLDLVRNRTMAERENLEPAGIREQRAVPVHEFMQAPHLRHQIRAGGKHQVVGVRQDNIHLLRPQLHRRQPLNARLRAAKDKIRRINRPVRRRQPPGAGV